MRPLPATASQGKSPVPPRRATLSCTEEGNGNPLQCSCLENPRDGGAWWAAVYGVAQSWTQLNRHGPTRNEGWRKVSATIHQLWPMFTKTASLRSSPLTIREMQIKPARRQHLTGVRMAVVKKSTYMLESVWRKGSPPTLWGACRLGQPLGEECACSVAQSCAGLSSGRIL